MSASKAAATVEVPARGKKWITGTIVRDRMSREVYRVTGPPRRYHEDCAKDAALAERARSAIARTPGGPPSYPLASVSR